MFCLIVLVSWISIQHAAEGLRNFVYQKDMSEFCRRRAMPSVFLSRQVLDTNSQMLHFSKLDLPYSCFTSIRTEASSNIIMVVQLMNSTDLGESCQESGNQLVVYELGETYGGYWGPMPEAVMHQQTWEVHPYTLPHPKPDILNRIVESVPEEEPSTTTTTRPASTRGRPPAANSEEDFVTWQVQLVNVTNYLAPERINLNLLTAEDDFDFMYDVTPRSDLRYETSLIPLVQFSMMRDRKYGLRDDEEPKYELEFNLGTYTPDYRLTTPIFTTRSWRNKNRTSWKKKKLLNKPVKLFSKGPGTGTAGNYILPTNQNRHTTYGHLLLQESTKISDDTRKETISKDSIELIEDIMKSLNKSKGLRKEGPQLSYQPLLKNISDMDHNFSAYLLPWSTFTHVPVTHLFHNITKETGVSPTSRTTERTPSYSSQALPTKYVNPIWEKLKSTLFYKQVTNGGKLYSKMLENIETSVNLKKNTRPLSLIDTQHKTVQSSGKPRKTEEAIKSVTETKYVNAGASTKVAPMLAGVLNRHSVGAPHSSASPGTPRLPEVHRSQEPHRSAGTPHSAGLHRSPASPPSTDSQLNRTQAKWPMPHMRRARTVEPIPIAIAKPHSRATTRQRISTTRTTPPIADSLHFAQLLEMPDDEMSSHMALRFIRQYAGARVYNICDQFDNAGRNRHVVLFNSSRILLAIANFTIPRITVVMTTANALRPSESRCPEETIECQVAGARVCIDSASACDGIPNCGAHDLYDEDRLQCGVTMGFQHSVCLAAMTFLMVILTMICIVHYWLNRCVPKVADAFFVYTDGAENVLFLDTIMRAPTDTEMGAPYVYDHSSFEENIVAPISLNGSKKHEGCCRWLFSRCLKCFKHHEKKSDSKHKENAEDLQTPKKETTAARKLYSFTEFELSKMQGAYKIDEAVQTGESLEMAFLKMINSLSLDSMAQHPNSSYMKLAHEPQRKPYKPVPVNPLLQNVKSSLQESTSSSETPLSLEFDRAIDTMADEKELRSTLYDPPSQRSNAGPSSNEMDTMSSGNAKKRLRFEEHARYISIPEEKAEATPSQREVRTVVSRNSISLGPGVSKSSPRRNDNSLETLTQESDPQSTIDFKRFFRGKKKKTNKQ